MSYVTPEKADRDPYEPGWVRNIPFKELGSCAGHPRVCPQSTIEDLRGLGECAPPSAWDWASRFATASTLVFLGMHLLKKKR